MCANLKLKEDTKSTPQSADDMSQIRPAHQHTAHPDTTSITPDINTNINQILRCACHTRYEKMKCAVGDIDKRYRATRQDTTRISYVHKFYHARIKKLTGIVGGSLKYLSERLCHSEIDLVRAKLEDMQGSLTQDWKVMATYSDGDCMIFEIYTG